MRGEDLGLRCLEIERARRKHGSLVDGQEQRCALLDDGVRTPGEAGACGGRRKPAERREGVCDSWDARTERRMQSHCYFQHGRLMERSSIFLRYLG
jgi:hypothetical protein